MICHTHKPLMEEMRKEQRVLKSEISLLNKNSKQNALRLKDIYKKFRRNKLSLLNANAQCAYGNCGVCKYVEIMHRVHPNDFTRRASSMVEHQMNNLEVVGSNPARGTKS